MPSARGFVLGSALLCFLGLGFIAAFVCLYRAIEQKNARNETFQRCVN